MENKLDFSLPEKKAKTSFAAYFSIILLLILIGLTAANFFIKPSQKALSQTKAGTSLAPDQLKDLASKLASRNLYTRAADLWQEYLSNAKLSDTDRATGLFQVASMYEKASMYDEAIEYFYRSEMTSKVPDLESQINSHIKDCFEKLGKFSALRYELMDRTSLNNQEKAGTEIVAEIGPEKITQADLNGLIEEAINIQLAPVKSFMTTDQQNEQKKKLLDQYKTPSEKSRFLQNWLAAGNFVSRCA